MPASGAGLGSIVNKDAKVLFLGLDNAGKTTLLGVLKGEADVNGPKLRQHMPTQQPTMEQLTVGRLNIKAFDLGGHDIARRVWKNYYPQVDGIVFMVDAHDRDRFEEARIVLEGLLTNDDIDNVPILVLGNKVDLGQAPSEELLLQQLGLWNATTGKEKRTARDQDKASRPLELFMCSVVRGFGFAEGFRWLSAQVK